MDSNRFIPLYDLERLSEDQKASYLRGACEFLGIPPDLNLLAFISKDVDGTGYHEVLYAKKGATDLLRRNRGISTVAIEVLPNIVSGQICFLAVGRDKDLREERAIGAAEIDGLHGKTLSDAIATAQTRAVRRMTLQFVGGGILDESEVSHDRTALVNSTPLDVITTQPVVMPNPTPSVVEPPPFDGPLFPPDQVEAIGKALGLPNLKQNWTPTPAQRAAQDALATVKTETLAIVAGENFKTVADLAATLPSDHPLAQAAEPPKQRKRKAAEITLNTPTQEASPVVNSVPTQVIPEKIIVAGIAMANKGNEILRGIVQEAVTETSAPAQLPAQPVMPPTVQKLLNPVQEAEIKTRLAKYRNEILPGGGMVPVASIGGVEIQLRKFVSQFNSVKPSSKTWDYMDWLKFIDFLDDVAKTRGAAGLVQYMQQAIGVIK